MFGVLQVLGTQIGVNYFPTRIWAFLYYSVPLYTDQNYKRNNFVFAPIFHELISKILDFFYVYKRPISLKYCSQICLNLC